jgi:sugar lactone lactonase YvrE
VISQGGKLVNPHGVALDADGNIIVSDGATGVIRVKPDGQQTVVASAGTGAPVGAGVDVRVDADGSYVVADGARGALVRVSPDGTARLIYRGAPFSQPHGPRGVVIDNSGNYVVVDEKSGAVVEILPDGSAKTIASGGMLCEPADITIYKPLPAAAGNPESGLPPEGDVPADLDVSQGESEP